MTAAQAALLPRTWLAGRLTRSIQAVKASESWTHARTRIAVCCDH